MQERDKLQLEYDAQRHKLKSYQEKAQKEATPKWADKLQRAEEKYDKRKEAFETANENLINELSDIFDQRYTNFEKAYKMVSCISMVSIKNTDLLYTRDQYFYRDY
jgi:hypothetical protein